MYRYETHLHTFPVSKCGKATVRESLQCYKDLGYDGVFITNHFLDGNVNCDKTLPYEDQIAFYFSDYREAKKLEHEIGIKVFLGVELSYKGTDFLVYCLDEDWFRAHPEIMDMKKSEELPFMMEEGALIIQAHPYREAHYIDHIRLFPRCVQGVEIINASQKDFVNVMAKAYAEAYELAVSAGSDNHRAKEQHHLAGIETETPIVDEQDFKNRVLNREVTVFTLDTPEE